MVPWVANKAWFFPEDKKLISFINIIIPEKITQNKPATATVVNFGVSFLHLRVTEKIANPKDESMPNINPKNEPVLLLLTAIIIIPIVEIVIDIQTFIEMFSLRNKKPSKAVIKGIVAKHKRVIAADVLVIDQIKVVMAIPKPTPPTNPEIPIFK